MSTSPPMEKTFDPRAVEPRWRRFWEEHALFRAGAASARLPFCMVIPPPNITGRLHVGHGLNNTLQDVLARWKRMTGHDVLWLPGSDHASIGTHVMMERALAKEGLTRRQLGREAFLERAWTWKEKYGGEIREQLARLGASCDWTRERFTMDPGLSRAVREVFVRLHEEGLIYRDRYLINWCPSCGTAVSDLEVVHRESAGTMWTVSYPLEGGGEIRVATTRPETILGDVAVAVHPDDERHRELVGRLAILPVLERRIPVVADPFVDPAFGTGAVKLTPGHDPNDFLAGRRLGLEPISIMDEAARMTGEAGPFAGMDRFACRAALLERLKETGRLIAEKDHVMSIGRCQRCDTIVEPMISRQWFVRMEPLARPALEAVERGDIDFIPEVWRKTYYEWMRNIRDWCISRQLWWGHRIPAWYCDACGQTVVAREDPAACPRCGGGLRQDPDILDTWFSSALWPFSTLGWPEETADLRRYYPTTVLVTGYDIIFFWVARMILMGLKFRGEAPFRTVFYNGLVRDAKGEKMSKTKGNVVDLFDLMDEYGTDAVRFTFTSMSSPGADVPLSPGRLDGSRAFANKIWNALRFARPHLEQAPGRAVPPRDALSAADRWILSRGSRVAAEAQAALEAYRFDEAAAALYRFTWHEVCDWYLELIKPELSSGGEAASASRAALAHTLDRVLRLLHPLMPFLTEELWQGLPREAGDPISVAVAEYPGREPEFEDPEAERLIGALMEVVTAARNLRASSGVAAGARVRLLLKPHDAGAGRDLALLRDRIQALTRASAIDVVEELPQDLAAARAVTGPAEIALPLEGLLDLDAERSRLAREVERLGKELAGHEAKLSNERFLERAKPEAVDKVRAARREISERLERLRETLARLGS